MNIGIASDWIDYKSKDLQRANQIADLLRKAGHSVTVYGWGPNRIQSAMGSNKMDIGVQIAGGICAGTIIDFYQGVGRYYKGNKGGFIFWNCWHPEWMVKPAHDWPPSKNYVITPYMGQNYESLFNKFKDKISFGYGNTVEDCAKTFLANLTGSSNNTDAADVANNTSKGSSAIELIKQVTDSWDPYGVEYILDGDTLNVKRTNINTAVPLTSAYIQKNTMSMNDYDSSTPNTLTRGSTTVKDSYMVDRFGQVKCTDDITNVPANQILAIARRGHGHSIDCKVVVSPDYQVNKWVKLDVSDVYNIKDSYYYITKASVDGTEFMTLTLEPAPVSRHVEITETPTDATANTDSASSGTGKTSQLIQRLEKALGAKINDYRSLYAACKNGHYKLYYNDRKSLETEIKTVESGGVLNCCDWAGLAYNALMDLGYSKDKVRYCNGNVYCSQTYGHVWLQINIDGNGWTNYDPSAAASKGYDIGRLICGSRYSISQYNPAWLLADDGRT